MPVNDNKTTWIVMAGRLRSSLKYVHDLAKDNPEIGDRTRRLILTRCSDSLESYQHLVNEMIRDELHT